MEQLTQATDIINISNQLMKHYPYAKVENIITTAISIYKDQFGVDAQLSKGMYDIVANNLKKNQK